MGNKVENLNGLDLSALDKLSPAEKELALSILKEYSESGTSKQLNNLYMEDYAEVPVDILTFVDDNEYLGNAWHDSEGKSKLYPYWRTELKKIFPDNLHTSVNNAIFSGSRGRGKSEIASLIAAYLLHRILCLKDPIGYFHLKPTEKIVFAFMNIKLALAEEIGIAKFQNTLQSSPWFMSHGELEGRTKKIWVPKKFNDQVAIDIKIGSQADDLIGLPVYFAFFDEVSFQRNQDIEKQKQKANDMIDTAIGGMKTRFVHNGKNPTLLVLASSKRSDKSFLEEHMKKKLKSEKENVYISDGSVWEVKPKGTYSEKTFKIALGNKFLQSLVIPDDDDPEIYLAKGYKIIEAPIDFRADFLDDIDRALCDFAGISSSSITKYISAAAFYDLVTDRIKNPFTREILEIGNGPDDDAQYYDFFDITKIDPILKSKPLYIHLDMSVSGDKTGIAGVFIKGKKPSVSPELQSNDLFYSLAFAVSIKAPKGRQISFEKNRNFIYWLRAKGFNIKGITSDTFQSVDTGQALSARGFDYNVLSVDRCDIDRICKPYQYFKTTVYERRLEIFDHNLLKAEVIDLERNLDTGKIDHPQGACFTGDTKVKLLDGTSKSFFDLVDDYKSGKENFVYSVNLDTKKIEPKRILKAWKTLENQPLVRLTLDNGEYVECTLNHRFMLRNGSYIEAKDLIPGDSLMPLYTRYPEKGGLKNYRMYYEPFEDKWHFEHRSFAKEILDEKYLVHHKDCNPKNNAPTNLIWCSSSKHQEIHNELETGAQSSESRKKRSQSVAEWHKNNRDTEIYKQRSSKTRESVLRYNKEKYGHNSTVDRANKIKELEKTYNIRWEDLTKSQRYSYGVKYSRLKDPTIQEKVTQKVSENHAVGKYKKAEKKLKESNQHIKKLRILFPTIDKGEFKSFFGFEYDSLDSRYKPQWFNRYRQKKYEILNHKITKIEFISKTADVYDIEVEDNHNFALDCGVFVHNSKDVSDAVCGAIFNASKHAEEYAYDYGESSEQLLLANEDSNFMDVRKLTLDMEEELKRLNGIMNINSSQRVHPSDVNTKTSNYTMYDDIIIL